LGILAYGTDNEGLLPALFLKNSPIATFWSHLILIDYLEARLEADNTHTNFSGTPRQGCSKWNRATANVANRTWNGAFGMNAFPLSEGNVLNPAHSNYVSGNALYVTSINLNQITKTSTRILLADALSLAGGATYLLIPVATPVTETSNTTCLKSWHAAGKLVTITMFDGHGEKQNITTAAAALINP
jgi:hypothetical protein